MGAIAGAATVPQIEVLVTGRLDAGAVGRWRALVDEAASMRPTHLIVDLSSCEGLDAAGIDMLVDMHRRVWADGGRLTLRGVSARLCRLLALARVDRVLQTADALAGYHPKHRADRRRNAASATAGDIPTAHATGEDVRRWETASSG